MAALNANEVLERTMAEMKARFVGKFEAADAAELLAALGGAYEVERVVRWTGKPGKEFLLRGANGREASVFGRTARVYEAVA